MTTRPQTRPGNLAEKGISRWAVGNWFQHYVDISLYRNSFFLILNSVVPAATGFVFWVLAARLYTVAEIGTASVTIAAMTLLMFFATAGLEYGLIRFLPETGKKSGEIVVACFSVSFLLAMLLAALFIAGTGIWAPALTYLHKNIFTAALFVVFTAIFSIYYLTHHLFIAKRRAGFAFAQTVVFSFIRFLPLVFLSGASFQAGIFSAWGTGLATGTIVSAIFLLHRIGIENTHFTAAGWKMVRSMVHYSLANFTANLLWMLPGLVLPLMVANQLDTRANAYFYIGWSVASIILMIPAGVAMSLFAEGANDGQRLPENVIKSFKLMFWLVVPAIVLVFLVGDKTLLLFGREYSESASHLLRLLALAAVPASINYTYFSIGRVQKRMSAIILLSGVIAITTLILSHYLLPRTGIAGAGLSYLLAQTVPALFVAVRLVKEQVHNGISREEPEYGDFIDGKKVSIVNFNLHLSRYRFARQFANHQSCLDIGCGTGYGSAYLASNGAKMVIAGDKSSGALSLNLNDNHLEFQVLDATALPFADESFGLITAFEVIEHIAQYEKLVYEAYRVLAKGGVLVLSTPNRQAGPIFFKTSWDHHVHEFSPGELKNLVNRSFGKCEVRGQLFVNRRELAIRRLRQTAGRTLEKIHLRRLENWLGRVLVKQNRLVVFHTADIDSLEINIGAVSPFTGNFTPATLIIVARKPS